MTSQVRVFEIPAEGGRRLTPEFTAWSSDGFIKRRRFERFRDCFANLPADIHSFPISFGNGFENSSRSHPESANPTSGSFAEEMAANPGKRYADIGAGLRDVVFENCMYVEVYPSLTTDVVIESNSVLPFKDASLDGIGCFAVLEHVREPWIMAAEFARVVKPGGKILIEWPFLQPVHGYPSHYYNATRQGLRALFEEHFKVTSLATGGHQGPDFTVQWILNWFLTAIEKPELRENFAKKTIGEIAVELPQSAYWRELLSAVSDRNIEILSCGNALAGTRNNKPAGGAGSSSGRTAHSFVHQARSRFWRRLFKS